MSRKNLINGQKPEFGNPEHIKKVEAQERFYNSFLKGPAPFDGNHTAIMYQVEVQFDCLVCGNLATISKNNTAWDWNDLQKDIDNMEETGVCDHCDSEFSVNEYGISMISNTKKPEDITP